MTVLSHEKAKTVAFALMALFSRDKDDDSKTADQKLDAEHVVSIAFDLGIPAKILAGTYFVENYFSMRDSLAATDAFASVVQAAFGDEYAVEFISEVSLFISRTREGLRSRQ